jgi:hypothetical protein
MQCQFHDICIICDRIIPDLSMIGEIIRPREFLMKLQPHHVPEFSVCTECKELVLEYPQRFNESFPDYILSIRDCRQVIECPSVKK